jgi:preprotein translocase subunit SecA
MGFLDTVLKSFLGDKNAKDLKEIKKVVDKIKKVEPAIEQLSDDELRGKTLEFKKKLLQLPKTSPNK